MFFTHTYISSAWLRMLITVVIGVAASSLVMLSCGISVFAAGTLALPDGSAPSTLMPKFDDAYIDAHWKDTTGRNNNDKIIQNLATESLIFRVLTIAKYILGGIFVVFFSVYVVELLTAGGNDEDIKKFGERVQYAFIGFLFMMLAEPVAYTFFIARDGGNFITNPVALKDSVAAASFTLRSAMRMIQYVLGGVALLFMGVAAIRMIASSEDAEQVKAGRKTIVWAMVGLIIAISVGPLVDRVLAPTTGGDNLVLGLSDPQFQKALPEEQHNILLQAGRLVARGEIVKYVKYFQTFIGGIAMAMLFLAGAKMTMAEGNAEEAEKQTKIITWTFLGLATILFSEVFVNIFFPQGYVAKVNGVWQLTDQVHAGDAIITVPGAAELSSFATQMGGLTNFLLSFAGAISVLGLIVGALFFALAGVSAEQAEKGKKIMLAAALGLLLTGSAFAIVNTVLSGKSVQPDFSVDIQLKDVAK